MDMNDLMKMVVSSGAIDQVSQQTGVSADAAAAAVQELLPALLGGMKQQATDTNTQASFLQALADHSKEDTDDLSAFVKKVDTEDGDKIVNHLLGADKEAVAAKAKKKSGLDTKDIIKIMAILAPILMAKMGNNAETAKKSSKSTGNDTLDIVMGLMDGIDTSDVIKIVGKLLK